MHARTHARQEVYTKRPTFCRRDTRIKRKGHRARDTEREKGRQTHTHKVIEEIGRTTSREMHTERSLRRKKPKQRKETDIGRRW